jgi:nucleoside-diphosphate-sugar epimerase
MELLILGGTGIISTACVELAASRGIGVTVLNRSRRGPPRAGVTQVTADVGRPGEVAAVLGGRTWDAVVDFLSFTPEDIERRIALFRSRAAQYLFVSSASAYQKPLGGHYLVTESTPLVNPFWDYSRAKIACEDRLMRAVREDAFPATIVRPSLTYGDIVVPLAVNSWEKSYTAVDRLRRGRPLIIPGDGLTLWTITHNSDFAKGLVGLLGQPGAIGHAFQIMSGSMRTSRTRPAPPAPGSSTSRPTSFARACRRRPARFSGTSPTARFSTRRR